jgi:hypothetical protein
MIKTMFHEHLNLGKTWANCFNHNPVNSELISINVRSDCSWKKDNRSQPRSGLISGATGPERSLKVIDHKKPVHISPVRFFPYLGIYLTGCGCGCIIWTSKNRTGPDFQTLPPECAPTTQLAPDTREMSRFTAACVVHPACVTNDAICT